MKSKKSIVVNLAMMGILSMLGLDSWLNQTPSNIFNNPIWEQAPAKADSGKDGPKQNPYPGPTGEPDDGWASKPTTKQP